MDSNLAQHGNADLVPEISKRNAALVQMKDQFTKDDIVVVLLHDHGSRYVGKIYNDEWMKEMGWLE